MSRVHWMALVVGLGLPGDARPEADKAAASEPERRTIVAGERYRKGGLHRFLFGHEYRDLWTTPVSVEVLDAGRFAGGLTPVRIVGHGQSKALALEGADGRAYTFRPVLKDPTGLLPIELRESAAKSLLSTSQPSKVRPSRLE